MTTPCEQTLDALSLGGPVPATVTEHARVCPGCAALLRAEDVLTHQPPLPPPTMGAALASAVAQGKSVRAFQAWRAVLPWAITACVLTTLGFLNTRHAMEMPLVMALLALCVSTAVAGAVLVARGAVGLGLPTSMRWGAVLGALVLLELAHAMWANPGESPDEGWWQHNLGCLRGGLVAALLCGLPLLLMLRRTAAVSPAASGALLGAASALPAVALLTLSCPVRESIHLLVFHAAVVVVGIVVGLVGGRRVLTP